MEASKHKSLKMKTLIILSSLVMALGLVSSFTPKASAEENGRGRSESWVRWNGEGDWSNWRHGEWRHRDDHNREGHREHRGEHRGHHGEHRGHHEGHHGGHHGGHH